MPWGQKTAYSPPKLFGADRAYDSLGARGQCAAFIAQCAAELNGFLILSPGLER